MAVPMNPISHPRLKLQRKLLNSALGPASRRAAVDGFTSLFLPGNIVALASVADAGTA